MIKAVQQQRPDGLLLALHGAMVAESHADADGEVLSRLRRSLGPELPIVVTFDLHGNLSQRQIDCCNAAVAYRTCPHVDQEECGLRAASLLQRLLRQALQPVHAPAKPRSLVNL